MTSMHWHLPPAKTLRDLLQDIRALKRERETLMHERDIAITQLGEAALEITELERRIERLRGVRQ